MTSYLSPSTRELSTNVTINGKQFTDLTITSWTYDAMAMDGDDLDVGSVMSHSMKIEIPSLETQIKQGDKVVVSLGLKNGSVTNYTAMGEFWVQDVFLDRDLNKTNIEAYDALFYSEAPYTPTITFPNTLRNVVSDALIQLDTLGDSVGIALIPNVTVASNPNKTIREIFEMGAQLAAGFACIKRDGKFTIKRLTNKTYSITPDVYHMAGLTISETNYKLGGIEVVVGENQTIRAGNTKGAQLKFENPYFTQVLLNSVWTTVSAYSFKPYSIQWFGDPTIEVGDILTVVDTKNVSHVVPVLHLSLSYYGGLTSTLGASQTVKNTTEYTRKGDKLLRMIRENSGNHTNVGTTPPSTNVPGKNGDTYIVYDSNGNQTMFVYDGGWQPVNFTFPEAQIIQQRLTEAEDDIELTRIVAEAAYAKTPTAAEIITGINQNLSGVQDVLQVSELKQTTQNISLTIGEQKRVINELAGYSIIAAVWEQGSINTSNGLDASSTAYVRSDRLSVKPNILYALQTYSGGNAYTTYSTIYVYYYNASGSFIAYGTVGTTGTFTSNANAAYVRLRITTTALPNTIDCQLIVGNQRLNLSTISNIAQITMTNEKLQLQVSETTERIGNQFVVGQWYLGNLNTTTGAEAASTSYIRSEYIKTEPGKQYISQTLDGLALTVVYFYYREDLTFISYSSTSNVVTIPANTAYMRIRATSSSPDTFTGNVFAGTTRQDYSAPNSVYSSMLMMKDMMNLRVSKNGIINQINISGEGILIDGTKIRITGNTTIDNSVIKTAMIDNLAVTNAKIADTTIASAKIASLNADKINAGTITTSAFKATYGNWEVDIRGSQTAQGVLPGTTPAIKLTADATVGGIIGMSANAFAETTMTIWQQPWFNNGLVSQVMRLAGAGSLYFYSNWSSTGANTRITYTTLSSNPAVYFANGAYIAGALSVSGTKNRVVDTQNFGKVALNAWESMGN